MDKILSCIHLSCLRSGVSGRVIPATNHTHPHNGFPQVLCRCHADQARHCVARARRRRHVIKSQSTSTGRVSTHRAH